MKAFFKIGALLLVLLTAGILPGRADVVPLTRVHAHNDYEHRHPLFDALDQGFCSVEADINLVNGELLVAHNTNEVDPKKTLQSLYLDPLRKRIKANGGRVYKDGPECTLLIDFKTEAKPTYEALMKVLTQYRDILTIFRGDEKAPNAITVILTGNYPRKLLAAEKERLAAGDGKVPDLTSNPPANLVPWISEHWTSFFKWRGRDPMPPDELKTLQKIIREAHEQGRKVRFWGSPDNPYFWKFMLEQGVDLINTDDLKGFQKFYNGVDPI